MKPLTLAAFACLVACGGQLTSDPEIGDAPPAAATTLTETHGTVAALAVDATDVYWIAIPTGGTQGTLFKAPKTGGTATLVASRLTQDSVYGLELGNELAYTNSSSGLKKVTKSGNASPIVVALDSINNIAVSSESLYWATADGVIHSTPAQSGTPSTLLTEAKSIVLLAVDRSHIYWVRRDRATRNPSTLMYADLNGTNAVAIDSLGNETGHPFLALDADTLYWGTERTIRKVIKSTHTATPVLAVDFSAGPRVRSDGRHLYAIDRGIRRISVSGGNATTVVTNTRITTFALDDGFVYWAEDTSLDRPATIRRVAK